VSEARPEVVHPGPREESPANARRAPRKPTTPAAPRLMGHQFDRLCSTGCLAISILLLTDLSSVDDLSFEQFTCVILCVVAMPTNAVTILIQTTARAAGGFRYPRAASWINLLGLLTSLIAMQCWVTIFGLVPFSVFSVVMVLCVAYYWAWLRSNPPPPSGPGGGAGEQAPGQPSAEEENPLVRPAEK